MDPIAQLGLYLFFVGSSMSIKHLCLIFGATPSVCSRTITAMLSLVVQKLKIHPWARVKFPDVDQMASFAQQIKSREPEVDDVIGFMDGLLLTSEFTSEMLEQNSMYNLCPIGQKLFHRHHQGIHLVISLPLTSWHRQ
jgi:hypothetical protein